MAIDISGYYKYFNTISSSITNNTNSVHKSNYNLLGTDNNLDIPNFDMAFLSMINQSQEAYKIISEKTAQNFTNMNDSDNPLYNELTNILNSYDSMRAANVIPKSIQESLFDMINPNTEDNQNIFFQDYENSPYSSELPENTTLEQLIYDTIKNL